MRMFAKETVSSDPKCNQVMLLPQPRLYFNQGHNMIDIQHYIAIAPSPATENEEHRNKTICNIGKLIIFLFMIYIY